MAFDYFTIQALAQELDEQLRGTVIDRAYARADQLSFAVGAKGDWFYGVGGRDGVLCLRGDPWPGAWNAGIGPEKYLVRARIVEVASERNERILRLRLERQDRSGRLSYGVLVCQLIPNKVQFILHREEGGEVLGIWGRAKGSAAAGQPYQAPDPAGRLVPGFDPPDAWNELLAGAEGDVEKLARRRMAGADASVVRELSFRAQGEVDKGTAMWTAAVAAYSRGVVARAFVWIEGEKIHFSALEPHRLQGAYESYERVSQAIWSARTIEREQRQSQQARQQVRGRLVQALKNGRRRLEAMRRELDQAGEAEECEKKGNALLAQIAQVTGGQTQIELADVYDPEGRSTLSIALDPNRSPAENAARYLKKVKKYRRRQQILPQRLADLDGQCAKFEQWIGAVEADTWRDIAELQNWLEQRGTRMEHQQKAGPSAHPRRYRTSTGWSVWAGRNNKENDILTHKMSAQNDMWFHAHGYPGSHVVLRREGRKEEPDKQTLVEAAGLAAFWSKGKTAKKVSVVYTQVKYVTKPRGGAPGQALLRREKAVVVEPSLLNVEDKDA